MGVMLRDVCVYCALVIDVRWSGSLTVDSLVQYWWYLSQATAPRKLIAARIEIIPWKPCIWHPSDPNGQYLHKVQRNWKKIYRCLKKKKSFFEISSSTLQKSQKYHSWIWLWVLISIFYRKECTFYICSEENFFFKINMLQQNQKMLHPSRLKWWFHLCHLWQ